MAIESARGAPSTAGNRRSAAGGFWAASKRLLGPDWPVAFVFAAPLVILLFGLIGWPLLQAVYLSFYSVGRGAATAASPGWRTTSGSGPTRSSARRWSTPSSSR